MSAYHGHVRQTYLDSKCYKRNISCKGCLALGNLVFVVVGETSRSPLKRANSTIMMMIANI